MGENKKLIDTRGKVFVGLYRQDYRISLLSLGSTVGLDTSLRIDKFPHYFGREVIGGLLDGSTTLVETWPTEDFDKQAKVLKLSEWWSPYDWTQKLKE